MSTSTVDVGVALIHRKCSRAVAHALWSCLSIRVDAQRRQQQRRVGEGDGIMENVEMFRCRCCFGVDTIGHGPQRRQTQQICTILLVSRRLQHNIHGILIICPTFIGTCIYDHMWLRCVMQPVRLSEQLSAIHMWNATKM